MENERSDVASDIEHKGLWGTIQRAVVDERLLIGPHMSVLMRV
jgi:hypothetical protein